MVLLTGAALALGVAFVAVAATQRPAPPAAVPDDVVAPAVTVPSDLSDGRTLGKADAPVTVEIWSDFQCPACRKLAIETEPSIIENFVVPGTAKLVYRDAAFQGARGADPTYDESVEAAAAARCAAQQDLFWPMHDWIFTNWNGENEGAFAATRLRSMASGAGLVMETYDACVASGVEQAAVRDETRAGVAAGIASTPTIVINGRAYAGALSVAQLSELITAAAR